jgi:hypothetical protein
MVRSHGIAILVTALTVAGLASAEEAEAEERSFLRDVDFSVTPALDFMLYRSDFGDLSYVNYGGFIGADYHNVVSAGLYLGASYVEIDFPGYDPVPIGMNLRSDQTFTLGLFGSVTPVRTRHFELIIRGSLLFPPGGMRTAMFWDADADVPDAIEEYADDYLDEYGNGVLNATVAWYRADLGLVFAGRIGPFRPYFELVYMHLYTAVEPELPEETTVEDPGHNYIPRASITDRLHLPFYWIGLDVNLPFNMAVGGKFMVVPAGEYGTLGAAQVYFSVSLNPHSYR